MKEIKAIVRTECMADLIHALKTAEVSRFYISRIHAVGSGVDPEDFRLSLDDGGVYTEKAKIEFLCRAAQAEALVDIVRTWAKTGHRGDGVVVVTDVSNVINVRTGDHDEIALL